MSNIMKRFVKGIVLKPESSDVTENAEGTLFQNSSELRIKTYIEGAIRQVVTNSQSQVLTNKTINAANNSIITAASGNLTSTELNAALSELQSSIDSLSSEGASLEASLDNFGLELAENQAWYSIAYSESLRRFVSVGSFINNEIWSGTDGYVNAEQNSAAIMTKSIDSGDWTLLVSPTHFPSGVTKLTGVVFGGNQFVAVGPSTTSNRVLTSSNGINWTQRTTPAGTHNWQAIAHGNNLYVAVGHGTTTSTGEIMTSTDGITWQMRTSPALTEGLTSITYGNNKFTAVGYNSTIVTSSDGINWTKQNLSISNNIKFNSVTSGSGIFIAVGLDLTNNDAMIMTSTDGISWTQRYLPYFGTETYGNKFTKGLSCVTYGGGFFIAYCAGNADNTGFSTAVTPSDVLTRVIHVSKDGIVWKPKKSPVPAVVVSSVYGDGKFLGVCKSNTNRYESFGIEKYRIISSGKKSTPSLRLIFKAIPPGSNQVNTFGNGWVNYMSGQDEERQFYAPNQIQDPYSMLYVTNMDGMGQGFTIKESGIYKFDFQMALYRNWAIGEQVSFQCSGLSQAVFFTPHRAGIYYLYGTASFSLDLKTNQTFTINSSGVTVGVSNQAISVLSITKVD